MLKRILTSGNKTQLTIAWIGTVIGLTIFFSSIHYFFLLRNSSSDLLNENSIIVQKKVLTSNILGQAKTDFSDNEINQLKQELFVSDVKKVISNNFDIYFETKVKSLPKFGTYAVIQSVEDDAISMEIENWKWNSSSEFVPILLPREMLIGLNTFMSAKGMPQISDDVIQSFPCQFTLSKSGQKEKIDCRVVGFTQSVASIVVPESFMEYGSSNFANSESQITQILVESEPKQFDKLENLLKNKNWESRKNQMLIGQLKSGISNIFIGLFALSVLIILLCFIILIQFILLRISENSSKIETLSIIGYSPKKVVSTFSNSLIIQFLFSTILSISIYALIQFILSTYIESLGASSEFYFSLPTILGMVLVTAIFVVSTRFFTIRKIEKIIR